MFWPLTDEQKMYVLFLISNVQRTKNSFPKFHVLNSLPSNQWIRICLKIAKLNVLEFGDDNGAAGYCRKAEETSYKAIAFNDSANQFRAMRLSKITMLICYGFDSCQGKECSHLCGNSTCLNINHLFPETHYENINRDDDHWFGIFGDQCEHNPCV
ncbi:hypothetical protein M3Y96_00930900 [Aphelenchoides besseyi]|nr:hypothetical protein M3Y96_00930900 [Aphelenchoides besseyi]